ncbi:MAG: hypothetical protein MUD01_27350 [Chloroflexaceae bacterium]|nr:hypothetical protein [Chloroflexaceae bacterium]
MPIRRRRGLPLYRPAMETSAVGTNLEFDRREPAPSTQHAVRITHRAAAL